MQSASSSIISKINKDEKDFVSKFKEVDGVFNYLSKKRNPFFLNLFNENYEGKDKSFFTDLFKEYSKIREKIFYVSDLKGNAGILGLEKFIKYNINNNLNINSNINSNKNNGNNENNFSSNLFFKSNNKIYKGLSKKNNNNEESSNKVYAIGLLDNTMNHLEQQKLHIKKLELDIKRIKNQFKMFQKELKNIENGKINGDKTNTINKIENAELEINKYEGILKEAKEIQKQYENNVKLAHEQVPNINNSEQNSTNYSSFYKKNLSTIGQEYSKYIRNIFKELHQKIYDIVFFDRERSLYEILLLSIKIDYLSLLFFYTFIESVKFKIIIDTTIKIDSYIYNIIGLYNQYLPSYLSWKKDYVNTNTLTPNKQHTSKHIDEQGLIFDKTLELFFKNWTEKIGSIQEKYKVISNKKQKIENIGKGLNLINKSLHPKSLLERMEKYV